MASTKKSSNKFRVIRYILVAIIVALMFGIFYTTVLPQYRILKAESEQKQVAITWLEEVRVEVPKSPTEPSEPESDVESTVPPVTEPDDSMVGQGIRYDDLWHDVTAYNDRLFVRGQQGLQDVFDYEVPSFDLSDYGVADDVFGAISIPKINVILPLYLGATYRHMADGFAQMSNTSIPIGGESTNAVMACHRGWNRMAYLRDVEMIELGDVVYVHNLWEDLEYRVVDIYVIEPDDLSILKIQEGRDLVTLFTCHPYGISTHRYVVVCERYIPDVTETPDVGSAETDKPDLMTGDDVKDALSSGDKDYITQVIQSVTITTTNTSDGTVESSSQVLFWTVYFPWILAFVLFFALVIYIVCHVGRLIYKKTKKKKKSLPIRML